VKWILSEDNKTTSEINNQSTYGIGDGFMISAIKIGKTTFIVSSYFENDKSFSDAMEPVIKHKINAS